MTLNVELLKQTLEAIEESQVAVNPPLSWDQQTWAFNTIALLDEKTIVCSTSACFAGWAVFLHDGPDALYQLAEIQNSCFPESVDPLVYSHIPRRAREILGLSLRQAENLFYGSNTLDDLRALVTGELDKYADD